MRCRLLIGAASGYHVVVLSRWHCDARGPGVSPSDDLSLSNFWGHAHAGVWALNSINRAKKILGNGIALAMSGLSMALHEYPTHGSAKTVA